MGENYYAVYYDKIKLADHMTLGTALLFIKAYAQENCLEDNLVLSLHRTNDENKILSYLNGVEWHQAKVETPDNTRRCLLFRNSESEGRSFCIGWYDCSRSGDCLWRDIFDEIIWDVTYWTELPEPHTEGVNE